MIAPIALLTAKEAQVISRMASLIVLLTLISALVSGCFPRHPPHTPQPVPEASSQQLSH